MYSIILAASISAVVAVAIYAVVTNLVVKTSIRKRRETAIKEAEAEGEMIKKERILQAKEKFIQLTAHLPTVTQNDIIVTNVRHYEALNKALEAIHRVQNGLDSQISGDFLSQDIRECIFFISDIAGEVTNDMVLQNIFQHFCIGK